MKGKPAGRAGAGRCPSGPSLSREPRAPSNQIPTGGWSRPPERTLSVAARPCRKTFAVFDLTVVRFLVLALKGIFSPTAYHQTEGQIMSHSNKLARVFDCSGIPESPETTSMDHTTDHRDSGQNNRPADRGREEAGANGRVRPTRPNLKLTRYSLVVSLETEMHLLTPDHTHRQHVKKWRHRARIRASRRDATNRQRPI